MRKTVLSIALLSLCYAQTNAQVAKKPHAPLQHGPAAVRSLKAARIHDAVIRQLTGSGQQATAAKTTATTDERLIAQSAYSYNDSAGTGAIVWMKTDSAEHKYSAEHGSYFNLNSVSFNPYYQIYSSMFLGQGQTIGFRDKDNKPDILSDSSHYYYVMDSLEHIETTYSVYDSSENIKQYTDDYFAFGFGEQYKNTFNSSGLSSITYLTNSGSTWDTTEYRTLGYTGTQLTKDSTYYYYAGILDPEYSYQYTYDPSGKATRMSLMTYDAGAGTWYEAYRYDLDYYPTNKLQKMTVSYSDGTSPLDVEEVDSFGWTTGVNYYTYYDYRSISTGMVQYLQTLTKHVSAAGLPDSVQLTTIDFSVSDTLSNITTYTYDTYKNPVLSTTYMRSTGSMAYDSVTAMGHFYYQPYTKGSVGISTVANAATTIKVYPNPASNELFITQADAATTGDIATVKIFNITGQLVVNTTVTPTNGSTRIAIDALPQGTYLVMLQNAQGTMLYKEKVVKL